MASQTKKTSRSLQGGAQAVRLAPGRLQGARLATQISSLILLNPYFHKLVPGLADRLMGYCVPVLNCWSCPLAAFACPIGAVGQFLARGVFPFLSVGILVVTGALVGRLLCGWVCPFGFLQDLLFRIPVPWKLRTPHPARWLKYAMLAVMVVAIPLLFGVVGGVDEPAGYFYCKWCPAGTLEASIPVNAQMVAEGTKGFADTVLGYLGSVKFWIAMVFLGSFVLFYRPFCKIACPIGAFMGLFNPVSMLKIGASRGRCSSCMACSDDCPMIPDVVASDNPPECIRCYRCDAPPCESRARARKAAAKAVHDGATQVPAGQPAPQAEPILINVIESRCKGCGFCVEFCPRGVLEMATEMNAKGYHYPKPTHSSVCMDCRLCESVCPEFAIFRSDDAVAAPAGANAADAKKPEDGCACEQ